MQPAAQVTQRSASTASGKSIAILALTGDVSSDAGTTVLNAYRSLQNHPDHVLLDFTQVSYINSSGIAVVIQLLMEREQTGGPSIAICGLTPHFQKIFRLVRVDKYAALYPDESAALVAFD